MNYIERDFVKTLKNRLQEDLNFIQVVLGPRQVGKTTGLQQIVRQWQGPSLMISADEVAAPNAQWLSVHWQKAREKGDGTLLVIDEVQKIAQWSTVVKHEFDRDRAARSLKVVLLGSASLSIQKGLKESMAGRFEVIPAHHWNYAECREAFEWDLAKFLMFGGYPAAAELCSDVPRWQDFIRNSIVEPVLIRDILGLCSVGKPALFRQTFELAMNYPAQQISLQKLLGQLQDVGNAMTIQHYLELLEGAYLLKPLQKYSGSHVRKKRSSPKLLPLNTALVHGFKSPDALAKDPEWFVRVFETAIGAALSRSNGQLYYWREGKFDVDFILELGRRIYAIEVKSARKPQADGMKQFHAKYPHSTPLTITQDNAIKLLTANLVTEDLLHSI